MILGALVINSERYILKSTFIVIYFTCLDEHGGKVSNKKEYLLYFYTNDLISFIRTF